MCSIKWKEGWRVGGVEGWKGGGRIIQLFSPPFPHPSSTPLPLPFNRSYLKMQRNIAFFSDLEKESIPEKRVEEVQKKGRTINEKRESIRTDGVEEQIFRCPRCGREDCPSARR